MRAESVIKGKYVGIVTINFSVDENIHGLLPFEQLEKSVKEELNGVVKAIIEGEVGEIAAVSVEQKEAELHKEG